MEKRVRIRPSLEEFLKLPLIEENATIKRYSADSQTNEEYEYIHGDVRILCTIEITKDSYVPATFWTKYGDSIYWVHVSNGMRFIITE